MSTSQSSLYEFQILLQKEPLASSRANWIFQEKVRQTIKIEMDLLRTMETEANNQKEELVFDKAELKDYRKKSRDAERRRNRLFERKLHHLLQDNEEAQVIDAKEIGNGDGESEDEETKARTKSRRKQFIHAQEELQIPKLEPLQPIEDSKTHPDPPQLNPADADPELEKLKASICRKLDRIDSELRIDEFLTIHAKISRAKEKLLELLNYTDPRKPQQILFGSV